MLIGAPFSCFLFIIFFLLCFNWSVCDLAWSLLRGKALEVEKLECHGKAWLLQYALGTPDRTSPLPSPAPSQPTDRSLIHKPLAQFVLLLSHLVQRI